MSQLTRETIRLHYSCVLCTWSEQENSFKQLNIKHTITPFWKLRAIIDNHERTLKVAPS